MIARKMLFLLNNSTSFVDAFFLSFIPLFVAVDAFGILPMFLKLTEGLESRSLRKIVIQSVVTALLVGLLFLAAGNQLLKVLGISIADFMVAGGIILFLLSISDLLSPEKRQRKIEGEDIGPVPIGVPLIVGPAVLTTGMLLIEQFGHIITSVSLFINVLIAGLIFRFSEWVSRILGKTGAKIISKLAGLLLASFAVMMVRRGIMSYVSP